MTRTTITPTVCQTRGLRDHLRGYAGHTWKAPRRPVIRARPAGCYRSPSVSPDRETTVDRLPANNRTERRLHETEELRMRVVPREVPSNWSGRRRKHGAPYGE